MITDFTHRWTFDEGSGSSAADSGGATGNVDPNVAWIPGKIGSGAVRFNKTSSSRVTFTQINCGNVYTIAFWFYVVDAASNADGVVVGAGAGDYALYFDDTYVYHSAGSNFVAVAHGGLANLRQWNHYAIARNAGTAVFYLNGTQLGASQPIASGNTLFLSAMGGYFGGAFSSQTDLDDVRVYDRQFAPSDAAELAAFTDGGSTQLGSADLSGNGSISVSGLRIQQGSSTLSGSANFTSSAQKELRGSTTLSGQGNSSIAASAVRFGSTSLSGGSGLIAGAAGQVQFGSFAGSGSGTSNIAGQLITSGIAVMSGTSDVIVNGQRQTFGSFIASGSSDTQASGSAERRGSASLSGQSETTALGIRETYGSLNLSGSASLTTNGIRIVLGSIDLSALSGMTVTGVYEGRGSAILSGSSGMVIIPSGGTTPIYSGPSKIRTRDLGRRSSGGLGSSRILSNN